VRTGMYTVGGIDRFDWNKRPLRPVDNVTNLPLDRTLLPQALKNAGYATAMFGKWHIGQQGDYLPGKRGFDEAIVSMGSHFDFPTNPKTEYPKGTYLADFLTDKAVDFITRHKDGPFFLYLPHNAVHFPLYPGKAFQKKSSNGNYGDWVEEVDWSVGRVLDTLRRFVDRAADAGATVSVGFEDASRADPDFLVRAAQLAQARGAVRVRYADTLGLLEPFTTHERIGRLHREIDIGIEMHAHNDLGLATANTLAAVLAGATHASTTVNGLGERAGNAALEEVVMAARHLYGVDCGIDTTRLPRISQLVAQASGRPVAAGKSIVGAAVFTHESGIHVDGLLKDRGNYEAFQPEELGREHSLVLGKHSGSHGVRDAYARLGMQLSAGQAQLLLDAIRSHVSATKRAPTDAELLRFYFDKETTWTA